MSMTDAGMSAAIKSAIEGNYGPATDDAKLQKFCDALGKAIVEYIQGNAVVNSTGTVTTGVGAGGAVVATGTVS